MNPEGRSAEQILSNALIDHSSWHFFQAVSWIDLAKRTQRPSALHYAAIDLRYGIEYLLFELLVLTSRGLTEEEYRRCVGDPHALKKALQSSEVSYEKLAEFTRILMSLVPGSPKMRYWKLGELFKYWGISSELLHFVGAHSRTYGSTDWFIKSLARLEEVITPIWTASTTTLGFGLLSRDTMEPEVRQAWEEFSSGTLSEGDLKLRMQIIQPVLRERSRTSRLLVPR